MRYYLIAGEASGCLHASDLMRGLRSCDPGCEIRFRRGDAVMGIVEVLAKAGRVLGNLASCKRDLLAWKPDAVILVDYPGFNLKIARFARAHGFRVFYYIAPKVWAHGASRVRRLKRDVDVLYCIFPFECDWFRAHGIEPRYFGNPLPAHLARAQVRPLGGRRIALLPGSRTAELRFLMPRFAALERLLETDGRFAGFRLVVAAAPGIPPDDYRAFLPDGSRIEIVPDRAYDVLSGADAALVSCGTATLEAALLGTPQVVCYGFRRLTWMVARRVVKVPFASQVNLCLGREAVPERLQDAASPEALFRSLETVLFDASVRRRMQSDYAELKNLLDGGDAAGRIANDIYAQIARV